ncbi:MAG: hypothetical protein SVM79_06305 [Chloroflexota bacterium]|nr:hypothetical protein [Chloroflexota bacterium]
MTESMAEEWEKWLDGEKSNLEMLKKQIDELARKYEDPAQFQYREFWDDANKVAESIKTLSPLPEDDRERLQSSYNRICREAKKRQEQEWQSLRVQSKQRRDKIEAKIREAWTCADAAPNDSEVLSKAQALLSEALAWLKNGGDRPAPAAERAQTRPVEGFLRDDRQACWDKWKEANDTIFGRRQAIWEQNYEQVHPEANIALEEANNGDPFYTLEKVKEVQSQLKEKPLSKVQREEVRGILNSAWEIAIAKVNVIRDENRRKHEEWQRRMQGYVEQWTDTIRKNKEMISELEEQIKSLQLDAKTSHSPDYAETVRAWIGEKRQSIREISESNKELEEKTQSTRSKLSE